MSETTEAAESSGHELDSESDEPDLRLENPRPTHGSVMWELAGNSGKLDLNSSYFYLLFARDFGRTSRLAYLGDDPAGFVVGYMRPEAPEVLFIWQIAVTETAQGRGIGVRMLDDLFASLPEARRMETTITADNLASQRLFESFAARHDGRIDSTPLFRENEFPDEHETESLYVISDLV